MVFCIARIKDICYSLIIRINQHLSTLPVQAPQPNDPDTLVIAWCSGLNCPSCIIATPFHDSKNVYHHTKSDRKDMFRRMDCCFFSIPLTRLNILFRKVPPGRTTSEACCSFPTKDWRSLFGKNFMPSQCTTTILVPLVWLLAL